MISSDSTLQVYLEREASKLKVNVFIEQAFNAGLRNKPSEKGCRTHLQNLINPTWFQSFESKRMREMREMSLEKIIGLIRTKASMRNPLHTWSMQLLKMRKTSTNSDFLQQLEQMMDVSEWSTMTGDKFLIHLFSEQLDPRMSTAAMENLAGPDPSVATLCKR